MTITHRPDKKQKPNQQKFNIFTQSMNQQYCVKFIFLVA